MQKYTDILNNNNIIFYSTISYEIITLNNTTTWGMFGHNLIKNLMYLSIK